MYRYLALILLSQVVVNYYVMKNEHEITRNQGNIVEAFQRAAEIFNNVEAKSEERQERLLALLESCKKEKQEGEK